jgi:hypothetical protein
MMATIIGLANIVGIVISGLVFLRRAELDGDWREFLLANLGFFLLTVGKMLVWWAVLAVWLAQGRPSSPWRATTELDGRPVRRILRVEVVKGSDA